jgi:DNA-binding response OmpR family regulator
VRVLIVGLREKESVDFLSCCSHYNVQAVCASRENVSAMIEQERIDAVLWSPEDLLEAQRGLRAADALPAPTLCIMQNPSVPPEQLKELRGDDFLFRPFKPEEAIFRLRLMLEKSSPPSTSPTLAADTMHDSIAAGARRDGPCIAALGGRLVIDENVKQASLDGERLPLTTKEFLLLSLLAKRRGQVTSCDEIIRHIWPNRGRASPADVQQYVYKLRRKIEANPRHPEHILNVKGFGYMLAELAASDITP